MVSLTLFATSCVTSLTSSTARDPDAGNSGGDSLKWSTVSYDLVSLFLHDLILVVIIGAVLLVLKFFFNCSCGDKSGGGGGGGGLPNINFSSNP